MGEEGVGDGGGGGQGMGEEGGRGWGKRGRGREILGAGVIPKFVVFLLYFYVLQCKHSVSEVSNDVLR